MALAALAAVFGAACPPPRSASRYEAQGIEPESLRVLVPAVARSFQWEWSERDSVQALRNPASMGGFSVCNVVFSEGSFVVHGPAKSVRHGRHLNDAIASCIVQEHRLRSGVQSPVTWTTKSHWKFAGATLVSPAWGGSYLVGNDPFRGMHVASYVVPIVIDAIGLALLFSDDKREAGLYTLAGYRALTLPLGLVAISGYNRMQHAPYAIELMAEPGFSTLGLKVVRRETFGWP